jgi:hypothetical protein
VAGTLREARELAEDGVRFVMGRDDVAVDHRIPASAA